MKKDILIEVFKFKANNGGQPENYGQGSFTFWEGETTISTFQKLVDIRIDCKKEKYFIIFQNVSEEITKIEFEELKQIFLIKKEEFDKRQEEKKKLEYVKDCETLDNLYKKSIKQQRKILIEKNEVR